MPKKIFIYPKQQEILLLICKNNSKLTFFEQNVYKNFRTFSIAMRELENGHFIRSKCIKIKKGYCMEYEITFNGLILKEAVKQFIEGNK